MHGSRTARRNRGGVADGDDQRLTRRARERQRRGRDCIYTVWSKEGAGWPSRTSRLGCQPAREDGSRENREAFLCCSGCHDQGCCMLMLGSYQAGYGRETPGEESLLLQSRHGSDDMPLVPFKRRKERKISYRGGSHLLRFVIQAEESKGVDVRP